LTNVQSYHNIIGMQPLRKMISNAAYAIYYRTPSYLHFLLSPTQIIVDMVFHLWIDQWIIAGKEVNSRQDLMMIFSGTKENKSYMANLAFGNVYQEKYAGKKWIWQADSKIRKHNPNEVVAITEIPKILRALFSRKWDYYIPLWVEGAVDISENYFSHVKKDRTIRSTLHKVKENGFSYKITKDYSSFNDFYHNMYRPYILTRYGNEAILVNYDDAKELLKKGFLLLVGKGETFLAGGLVSDAKNSKYFRLLGVRNGNNDYVSLGVIGALYYFLFSYCLDIGCKKVYLGDSRPFLRDGTLNYKQVWDQKLCGDYRRGFLLSVFPAQEGATSFLLNNPFMYIDETGMRATIFKVNKFALSENEISLLQKRYSTCSLQIVQLVDKIK
jgi:hypothetical protein